MTDESFSQEERKRIEQVLAEVGPEFVAKYGNPLDPNDPRHWAPTERGERGLSINDRIKLLELDMEVIQLTLGKVVKWISDEQAKQFVEELKKDPEKALAKLRDLIPKARGANGDSGPAYAGSTRGLKPEDQVETPDGIIRADQIPGYRNDPDWTPSPDWAEANCMCPVHVAQREAAARDTRFDGPTGMYL